METGSANKGNKVVLGAGMAGQGFVSMPEIQLIPTLGFMYCCFVLCFVSFPFSTIKVSQGLKSLNALHLFHIV